jgi:hypothetical protein
MKSKITYNKRIENALPTVGLGPQTAGRLTAIHATCYACLTRFKKSPAAAWLKQECTTPNCTFGQNTLLRNH